MMNKPIYNTYVIITSTDFQRVSKQYHKLLEMLPSGRLIFVGQEEVGKLVRETDLGERAAFLCEDEVLPFSNVWDLMNDHMKDVLQGDAVPRGGVGWYYQQFVKYLLAFRCEEEYYMTWDGDTIPCREVKMFADDGRPYMDNKNEYHEEYFTTLGRLLPGMHKVIQSSFISEHMIFHAETVKQLMTQIEANGDIPGKVFWEKVIRSIDPLCVHKSAFSEFETYGTYVALNSPGLYRIREWHSFRLGGEFFDPETICERDYVWLGKDFDAISFEKNHRIKQGNGNLFDNPKYQAKLSARQMLEIAQEGAGGGYLESWNGAATDPLA